MSKLHRIKGESPVAHRAFLLWVMQANNQRSKAAVARAIRKSHTTINNYLRKNSWEERNTSITDEAEAQQLYRNLYMPTRGMVEFSAVQMNIASPVSVSGIMDRSIGESVSLAVAKTKKDPVKVEDKEIRRKHLLLLDAAITYIAQGLKAGDMKRQIRDLPLLIQLRNHLMDNVKGVRGGEVICESVRVKEAKSNGTNILDAMYEDAKELTIILGALRSNEAHQAIHGEEIKSG